MGHDGHAVAIARDSGPSRPRPWSRPVSLTVLSVAYPLAPVGPDAVGGAEQVLSHIDQALVAAGHRSIVVAQEGSRTAGTLVAVRGEYGVLDEAARQRAWERHRLAI